MSENLDGADELPEIPEGPASALAAMARGLGFRVADAVVEPPRAEVRAPLNARHRAGAAGRYVDAKLGEGVEPWRHQALALDALERGENVVLTTPTASGKSLVFQAHGLDVVAAGGRVIVLYPVKALASDQMRSWRQAVAAAGMPPEWVGEITGDVPVVLRKDVLASARIVSMTPDVLHAWMMGLTGDKDVRAFLAETRLVVLDEAHVLDAAFGSSAAFLFRRLQAACDLSRAKRRIDAPPFAYVASSATVEDPVGHLSRLTGRDFSHVSEADDGSPRHGRTVLHVVPEEDAHASLVALQKAVADDARYPFVAFCDSRKGVEMLAMASNDRGIMPYRNGYEAKDRQRIEAGVRDGGLKGVVATSALEMGIDMGRLRIGLNLGADATRRSIRQRIGRVGRAEEGAFAVVSHAAALSAFGESFRDYVGGPVEPSILYLDNRVIQYQHARCLHAEMLAAGVRPGRTLPAGIAWPEGFASVFAAARPDREPPAEFADVHRLNTGKPHLDYALRSVGEKTMEIETAFGKRIGSISRSNALKEAYPDGTYLHLGQRYTVSGWKPGRFGPKLVVRPGAAALTKPILRTYVNGRVDGAGLVDGRIRGGGAAFVAEARLSVRESVVGYTKHGKPVTKVMYAKNGGPSAKHRNLRTTGVVARIPFLAGRPVERLQVAVALAERYRRSYGIAASDVNVATDGIGVRQGGRMAMLNDTLAFYDTVQGSLRLSQRMFEDLPGLVAGLCANAEEHGIDGDVAKGLEAWLRRLDTAPAELFPTPTEMGEIEAYEPGTRAVRRKEGRPDQAVSLVEPVLVMRGSSVGLGYVYRGEGLTETGVAEAGEVAFDGPEPATVPWCPDAGYADAPGLAPAP